MKTIKAWLVVLAGALLTLGMLPAYAAPTPAGTVIGNQATATYNDAGGTPRTATSNQVTTTVSQVKSFTLNANGARTAAPGQTVYYPHVITNTGNGSDTYALNAPASSNFAGPTLPHSGLAYFIDADGDGVPDNAVPITTTGPIAAGGLFKFVVAGTVPNAAANGNTATITVSVSDTQVTTNTNTDTTTVASSVITVTKSLSQTSGPAPNAGPITVTLSYTNSGTSDAVNVVLTDILPTDMQYIAASGTWSVSGATVLTDAAGGDPAGINYSATGASPTTVAATIALVPAGFSGTVKFNVRILARPPGFVNNTATFQTSTQGVSTTNIASYQVLQTASVVANGSATNSTNGTNEPVTVGSAAAGATFTFQDYVWNYGNSTDSFLVALTGTGTWPAGTTFTLLQQDNSTSLIGNTVNSVPVYAAGCPAGYVADVANQRCGYLVNVRVQLPASASGGPYSATLTATSSFDNTKSDPVINTLTVVSANSVDLTNNLSVAGGATVAQGLGNTGTTVITTNPVTPSTTGPTVTRFSLYVNNTGAVNDNFNLSVAGVPAGWSVVFRADGGALPICSTVGATLTSTGTLNAGTSRLVCAEVTVPMASSGQAPAATTNLDFTVVSSTNAAVTDVKRDAVTVNAVHAVALTPNNIQQTYPGGAVTYTHVLTNSGNSNETISFAAGFLTDSRTAQGWTSTAYLDDGDGVFTAADQVPANVIGVATTFALAPAATRTIFVRVFAPPSATSADPANVTLLTARYNAGASSTSATDSTTVTDGLLLTKRQRTINCDGSGAGAYTGAAIPAGPATAPQRCLQYEIVAQNTTALNITLVVLSDLIPPNTKQKNACGAPAVAPAGPVVSSPGDGGVGTITVPIGTMTPSQSSTLTFCVQID